MPNLVIILKPEEEEDTPKKQIYKDADWTEESGQLVILFERGKKARIQLTRIDSYYPEEG